MIRRIHGEVVDVAPDSVVIDVAGVGYLIHTGEAGATYTIGEAATLYTYLAVQERALDLYGFKNQDTLQVFEILISLPKIGPKSAAQILGQADIDLLKEAVQNEDPSYLSKMSGIGKKSAEKIVLGLKDKFETLGYVDEGLDDAAARSNGRAFTHDTIDALIALGYPQSDARKVVQQIQQENPQITSSAEAIKLALTKLNGT